MIHQYKNNGYNIVMDIASGSVHVVDDVVYDAVALLEPVIGEVMTLYRTDLEEYLKDMHRRGDVPGADPGNRKKECRG